MGCCYLLLLLLIQASSPARSRTSGRCGEQVGDGGRLMPLPQVEIKPLTASLLKGQSVSLRCLSPDENMRTFFYQVSRNFTARVVLG